MSHENLVEAIEQQLFDRELNCCERYILEKSWEGEQYSTIAKEAGYDKNYIKQVGAKLWSDLSSAIGKNVTKKNLRIVLSVAEILTPKPDHVSRLGLSSLDADPSRISFPSSPLSSNSALYINRPPIEDIAYAEIESPGCLLRIHGARKIGKSSLLNQILTHSSAKNLKSVTIDLQEAETNLLGNLDRFLQWFCTSISHQLGLPAKLEEYWQLGIGSKVSCKIYLEYLLEQIDRPLILAINELNRLFKYPDLMPDFLSMLRFWHEQSNRDILWQKLRLVLVYSTETNLPLNLNQSLFNAGLSLQLPLFNFPQTVELARRYGFNFAQQNDHQPLKKLYQMINGHPYLTSLAFYHLQKKTISFSELIKTAPTPQRIFHNHLFSLLISLRSDSELTKVFKELIETNGKVFLDAIAAHQLNSLGLIKYERGVARPMCQLYRLYFKRHLASHEN